MGKAAAETLPAYYAILSEDKEILPGEFDYSHYLKHLNLPEDLSGKRVLDVGTREGYFAYWFEKHGAEEVVALDVKQSSGFRLAHKALKSNVHFKRQSIVQANPDALGEFDLVFCENLLWQVTDLYRAVERIRRLTRGEAIICSPIFAGRGFQKLLSKAAGLMPVAFFLTEEEGCEQEACWLPNTECLKVMMHKVGFSEVKQTATFTLKGNRPGREAGLRNVFHMKV